MFKKLATAGVCSAILIFSMQPSYSMSAPTEKPAEPLDGCQQKLEDFVNSDTIPADMWPSRGHYETMGFKFGSLSGVHETMVLTTLPHGWTRTISEDMYTAYIIDYRDDERVLVRCGENEEFELIATMLPRYSVESYYHPIGVEVFARDRQGNLVINYCGDAEREEDGAYPDVSGMIEDCQMWLDDNYPGNNDPLGYWE